MHVTIRPLAFLFGMTGLFYLPSQRIADAHSSSEIMMLFLNWIVMIMLASSVSISWGKTNA